MPWLQVIADLLSQMANGVQGAKSKKERSCFPAAASLPASDREQYSASQEERAVPFALFVAQETGPPDNKATWPKVDQRS